MTDTQQNDAHAEARAAIENDEIALRIRALGVAIVTAISTMDKNNDREQARDASDPVFLIMESALDVFDMVLRDMRRKADAGERIATALEKMVDFRDELSSQLSEQG